MCRHCSNSQSDHSSLKHLYESINQIKSNQIKQNLLVYFGNDTTIPLAFFICQDQLLAIHLRIDCYNPTWYLKKNQHSSTYLKLFHSDILIRVIILRSSVNKINFK